MYSTGLTVESSICVKKIYHARFMRLEMAQFSCTFGRYNSMENLFIPDFGIIWF